MHTGQDTGAPQPSHNQSKSCCGGACSSKSPVPPATASTGGCCGGGGGCGPGGCGPGGCGPGASGTPAQEGVYVFSRRQIRELDRLAVETYGMPSILLMENAARGIASVILEGVQDVEAPTALILCGPGNNGGDGLAVARHLHNRGMRIAIVLANPPTRYTGDALINLNIVQNMGLPIFESTGDGRQAIEDAMNTIGAPVAVIDALLGTGTTNAATGLPAELIARANELRENGCSVISIDVPSGLDCDSGEPAAVAASSTTPPLLGPAIRADITIALCGVKAGFMSPAAAEFVGELVVVDIGVPQELVRRLGRPLHESVHSRT